MKLNVNLKITEINKTDIYTDVKDKLKKSLLANGQSMNDDELDYSSKLLTGFITDRYKNLNYGHINQAFRRGLAGDFGKFHKVTVVTINSWISQLNSEIQESNRIKLATNKNHEETMKAVRQDGWGSALMKRQDLINSGKSYNLKYQDREKYPLKKIKELMDKGEI